LNRNFAHGKWWGDEASLSRQILKRQRLTVGSEFRHSFQQDQGNYDIQPFVQYFADHRTSTIFSVYAQDEIRLHRDLVLNLGLRYDHYSIFGGSTNPRAALIYNPWQKTTFKALYGNSFRAPNLFELFYSAPGNEANKILKGWEVSATVYNAFNRKYSDPTGNGLAEDSITQDGRNFRIKIGYQFSKSQ
jgi:outer membrane receptor for ferrienterochelin and colicin